MSLDALCGKGHRQRSLKDFRLLNYWESYRVVSRRWRQFEVAEGVAVPVTQTLYVLYTNAGPQDLGGDRVDAEASLRPLLTAEDDPGLRFRYDAAAPALPGVSRGEAEAFLENFRLLAGQPDYAALGAFVEREVAAALLTPATDTRVVAEALRNRVKDWRDKTPSAAYLGKDSALWTDLLRERVRHFNGHIMVEDNNFCLKYRVPLEDLAATVRDSRRPLALVARERMTKAVLWKVYQALGDVDGDALVVSEQTLRWRREELLRLWTRRPCRVLLVEAEGDLEPELLADLEGVLDGDASKRLVAVTYGVQESRHWVVRNVDVAWTDVEPDSLEQLLDLYAKKFDPIKPQTTYLCVVIGLLLVFFYTQILRDRSFKLPASITLATLPKRTHDSTGFLQTLRTGKFVYRIKLTFHCDVFSIPQSYYYQSLSRSPLTHSHEQPPSFQRPRVCFHGTFLRD